MEMEWFGGKNTWGNFPDLVGAVNKLQESVKNIEKNFDTALGFEDNPESSNEGNLLALFKFQALLFVCFLSEWDFYYDM